MARDAILATAYLLWGASNDQTTTAVATIWPEVNDMVTAFYDIHIMLYHHNGMATAYESIKGGEQFLDVVEVESRGWLVSCVSYHSFKRSTMDCFFAVIAQLVEHWLPKPRVAGSSPVYRSFPILLPIIFNF